MKRFLIAITVVVITGLIACTSKQKIYNFYHTKIAYYGNRYQSTNKRNQ